MNHNWSNTLSTIQPVDNEDDLMAEMERLRNGIDRVVDNITRNEPKSLDEFITKLKTQKTWMVKDDVTNLGEIELDELKDDIGDELKDDEDRDLLDTFFDFELDNDIDE